MIRRYLRREPCVVAQGLQVDHFTPELEAPVPNQCARQKAGFAENLKSVADAKHRAALSSEFSDRLHDGAESGDGPAAEIIAVAESAGNDDRICTGEAVGFVPEESGGMAEDLGCVNAVLIAIRGGKLKDGKLHDGREMKVLSRSRYSRTSW